MIWGFCSKESVGSQQALIKFEKDFGYNSFAAILFADFPVLVYREKTRWPLFLSHKINLHEQYIVERDKKKQYNKIYLQRRSLQINVELMA